MIAVILTSLAGVFVSGVATTIITRSKINVGFDKAYTENVLFESPVRSKLHCAVLCNQHDCCSTFTFDHKVCRGHAMMVTSHTPSTSAPGARSYTRKNAANKPKNCVEAKFHSSVSGVVTLYPEDDSSPLQVYCDHDTDGGGWLVFQRRQDGSVDFYRNWTEYQCGFGDVLREYWLGLDALHMLTCRQRYELRVDLMMFSGTKGYATYSKFSIGDSSDNYRLRFDKFTGGNANDSLLYNNGLAFSTLDADHDISNEIHCGRERFGGWWYGVCGWANLNGLYTNTSEYGYEKMTWVTFHNLNSLKFAEMRMRIL